MSALRGRIDPFLLALLATVLAASLLPATGTGQVSLGWVTYIAITLLFFFQGAKRSRAAVPAALTHWQLHRGVLASSFMLFYLAGLAVSHLVAAVLPVPLAAGLLFPALLPSTVQSSIAITSAAYGNVPAAVCSASASNLLGIFLTPALATVLFPTAQVVLLAIPLMIFHQLQLQLFACAALVRRYAARQTYRNAYALDPA